MNAASIRSVSTAELLRSLREKRQHLLMSLIRKESGRLDKTHVIREQRKDIARLLLVLSERGKVYSGSK